MLQRRDKINQMIIKSFGNTAFYDFPNNWKERDRSVIFCQFLKVNKVDSIYIFFPWFRFTLMDRALRVLFHRFQTVFDRIRLTFSVTTGTKSTNAIIKYSCFLD